MERIPNPHVQQLPNMAVNESSLQTMPVMTARDLCFKTAKSLPDDGSLTSGMRNTLPSSLVSADAVLAGKHRQGQSPRRTSEQDNRQFVPHHFLEEAFEHRFEQRRGKFLQYMNQILK